MGWFNHQQNALNGRRSFQLESADKLPNSTSATAGILKHHWNFGPKLVVGFEMTQRFLVAQIPSRKLTWLAGKAPFFKEDTSSFVVVFSIVIRWLGTGL